MFDVPVPNRLFRVKRNEANWMKSLHFCLCVAVKHPRETNRSPWAGRNSTWTRRRCSATKTLLSFSNTPSSIETNSHPVFSSFPPQGIQFLLENDLLQHTPEDIAQFLYKGEGLNKTVIGDYLGERWDRTSVKSSLYEIHASSVIREGNYGLDLLIKEGDHDWPPRPMNLRVGVGVLS